MHFQQVHYKNMYLGLREKSLLKHKEMNFRSKLYHIRARDVKSFNVCVYV